jgi:hypothetical protein
MFFRSHLSSVGFQCPCPSVPAELRKVSIRVCVLISARNQWVLALRETRITEWVSITFWMRRWFRGMSVRLMNCASELSNAVMAWGSAGRRRRWITSSMIPEEMCSPTVRLWRACACRFASRILYALFNWFTVGGWNKSNVVEAVSTLSFRFLVALMLCSRLGSLMVGGGGGAAFACAFQIGVCGSFRCYSLAPSNGSIPPSALRTTDVLIPFVSCVGFRCQLC